MRALLDPQDAALLAARDAFEANHRAKLATLAPKLKGHLLEPYVEYWQLFFRLPGASAEDVRDFLSRYPDTALAEQLRADWLKVLGRSGRWELFQAEYPALSGDDPEVTCYMLLARWKREDAAVPGDFKVLWNAPRELPEGCLVLARVIHKAGQLGSREAWERFRVLVGAGLMGAAKRTMEFLPRGEAIDAKRLGAVIRAPVKFLRNPQVDLAKVTDRELVIAALTLVAETDARAAAGFWGGGLSDAFPVEDRRYVWLMLAMNGALRHVPDALDWFGELGALTDEQLGWRARIAMRTAKWAEVRSSIDRMSPLAKNDPVWIYWYGRAEPELLYPPKARSPRSQRPPGSRGRSRSIAWTCGPRRRRSGSGRSAAWRTGSCSRRRSSRGATKPGTGPSAPRTGRSSSTTFRSATLRLIAKCSPKKRARAISRSPGCWVWCARKAVSSRARNPPPARPVSCR